MKKRNWLWVLIIILSLGAFVGYRMLAAMRADTRAPEIHMASELMEVSVEDPRTALLQGITADDNKDGDVTDSIVVERITMLDSDGNVSVSYAAFDAAGNVTRAERKAVYTDYVSPRFTLSRPLQYTQGTSFDILANVGATDVFDGEIQHRVRANVLGEAAISTLGTHMVEFKVTNSLGDTHTVNLPVEVSAYENYGADLKLKQYLVYLPVGAAFNAASYLDTFSYQRELVTLDGVVPAGFDLETVGNVQTRNPGVYTLDYTLKYSEKNENGMVAMKYSADSRLIVIVEG